MTDRYAVVGHPISHSQSPRIHAAFAAQTGQDLSYSALLAPLEGFAQTVDEFRAAGGKGLNVTVPFKPDAWQYASQHSERAARAEAVNTLVLERDRVYGDNTDGPGLLRDLTVNQGCTLQDQRIVVIGAGGAAAGVLAALLATQPGELVIANRTASKALELAERFSDLGLVSGCGLAELAGDRFDLLINATAASLDNQCPALPVGVIHAGSGAYDLMYAAHPTPFMRWAQAEGAAWTRDGLGMLVEQAAESFAVWRGVRPETHSVLKQLRSGLVTYQ